MLDIIWEDKELDIISEDKEVDNEVIYGVGHHRLGQGARLFQVMTKGLLKMMDFQTINGLQFINPIEL